MLSGGCSSLQRAGVPLWGSPCCRAQVLGHASFSGCGVWAQSVGFLGSRADSVAVGMSLVALWHVGLPGAGSDPCLLHRQVDFFLTTESPRKALGKSEFSEERYTFGAGISTSPFPAGRLCSATACFTSCLPSLPSGLEAIPLMWSCCCSVAELCLTPGSTPDSSDPYCLSELAQNSLCYSKVLLIQRSQNTRSPTYVTVSLASRCWCQSPSCVRLFAALWAV